MLDLKAAIRACLLFHKKALGFVFCCSYVSKAINWFSRFFYLSEMFHLPYGGPQVGSSDSESEHRSVVSDSLQPHGLYSP